MRKIYPFLLLLAFPGSVPAATAAPLPAPGWTYTEVATGLDMVDNLAVDDSGTVYATLEQAADGGKLIRLDGSGYTVLIDGLDRADGLFFHNNHLYLTEEVTSGRILDFDLTTSTFKTIGRLTKPEGIGVHPQGGLVIAEDTNPGRLVHLALNGVSCALATGLNRPEGLVVKDDGTVLVAETATGKVLEISPGGSQTVLIDSLNQPDQLRLAPDGALWITEDQADGRLLRYLSGTLTTVLDTLYYPQGMWFDTDGSLLLSEQGNDRILRISPIPG
jgi:sugar lactone lactonase YvrE